MNFWSRPTAMHVAALVTAVNVLVASGFAIAGLISPQSILPPTVTPNEASHIIGLYGAARTIPLALFALAAIYRGSTSGLLILGGLAGLIQVLDGGIGIVQGDPGKTVGPLAIAALQLGSLIYLRRATLRDHP